METPVSNAARRLPAVLLFLAALVLFAATTSRYAFPEESAAYLAQHTALVPFPPMSHVPWGWIVRALAGLRIGPMALLPNLFSALCGAGCVALVFLLVSRLSYNLEFEITSPWIRTLAGVAAALYAAVSLPLWSVSNRAHPVSLDLLLLLGSLYFIGRYRDGGRRADLYTFALIYGVALAEFPTCILLVPPLGMYVLLLMKRNRDLRPGPLVCLLGCAMPVALIFLAAAWQYDSSPARVWREFQSFGQIVKYFPREEWLELRQSVPPQGWLIAAASTFAPWMICLYINRRGGFIEGGAGSHMLHTLMLAVSLAVLFRGPSFPWSRGSDGQLLVTPYLMSATCFGYALGYGLALYLHHAPRRRWQTARGKAVAVGFTAAAVVTAGLANGAATSCAPARDMHVVARATLGQLAGRTILVSQGPFDAPLLIEARDAGLPLQLVNMTAADGIAYRKYIGSLVSSPRLQGLALAGVTPMLLAWLQAEPDVETQIAMQITPDYWLSAGFQIIPHGYAYLGARRLTVLDAARLMDGQRAYWKDVLTPLRSLAARPDAAGAHAAVAITFLSRVANDLGILMENLGRLDDAALAYRQAADIEPLNVVSLANLHDLCLRRGDTNRASLVWTRIDASLAKPETRPSAKTLLDRYGHVRTKESYNRLNAFWQAGGESAPAEPELAKAQQLYAQRKLDEAMAVLDPLVEKTPELDNAWIMLATVAYERGDEKTVQRCLSRMRLEKQQWPQLLLIMANLALRREDYVGARDYLEAAAAYWPGRVDILEKLATIYLREGSRRHVEYIVQRLLILAPENPVANCALGSMLLDHKQYDLAEDAFLKVNVSASYPMAQAQLSGLFLRKGERDEAYLCAQRAVEMDSGLAEAWDALGQVLTQMKKSDEAGKAFKKATELKPISMRRAAFVDPDESPAL